MLAVWCARERTGPMIIEGSGINATPAGIAGAIQRAAQATGASFDYLLAAAKVESNLDPNVKSPTSSATGLFQFIEQTWLATLKLAGPALGYGRYADAIVQTPSGYVVPDAGMRVAVMNLRRNPAANATMAGAFTRQNGIELRERLGRPATTGELYIAHFLGSNGAARLIIQAATAPQSKAADLFPSAAAANRSIFYDRNARARSAGDVYSALVGRFEHARAATQALVGGSPPPPIATAAAVPDTAGLTDAFAMVSAVPVARGGDAGPAFHSLFQTVGRRQPISPVVAAFWGGTGADAAALSQPLPQPLPVQPVAARHDTGDLRELYRNGRVNSRGLFDGTS
jgi:hypothetical protein